LQEGEAHGAAAEPAGAFCSAFARIIIWEIAVL
jgi:hypothetical protein